VSLFSYRDGSLRQIAAQNSHIRRWDADIGVVRKAGDAPEAAQYHDTVLHDEGGTLVARSMSRTGKVIVLIGAIGPLGHVDYVVHLGGGECVL